MDYKWSKIIALDCAIAGITIHVVTNSLCPYNFLYGSIGGVALVTAHNWALDHFADGHESDF